MGRKRTTSSIWWGSYNLTMDVWPEFSRKRICQARFREFLLKIIGASTLVWYKNCKRPKEISWMIWTRILHAFTCSKLMKILWQQLIRLIRMVLWSHKTTKVNKVAGHLSENAPDAEEIQGVFSNWSIWLVETTSQSESIWKPKVNMMFHQRGKFWIYLNLVVDIWTMNDL